MRRFLLLAGIVALIGAVALLGGSAAQSNPEELYVGTVPAPAFPTDLDWINVDEPLSLDGLRGKIIVLDFWTYGCINCIHMIPVLEEVGKKYEDEVVIISVHSAKFDTEGQTENLRQIVQRYGIDHPVINDNEFRVWNNYGARAWPTFAIVDPRGNVTAMQAGEIPYEVFDAYLGAMIDYYDGLGDEIDRTPLELALEGAGDPGTPLLYPGKVLADAEGERLFIADSSHHRLVIADLNSYEVLATIGTGARGFDDGNYSEARFDTPQGLALINGTLYVADTNNHAIRAIDLDNETVTTVAGSGVRGRGLLPFGSVFGEPTTIDLRSPWDVEAGAPGELHIAMAGSHQLWIYDIDEDTIRVSVGNGREAQLNGSLGNSELAQPSGLYYDNGLLYFADSESSTIRAADFNTNSVEVISGTTENNLFDYGDIDGPLGENRLQHPLDVVGAGDGLIYIADTYNSRIKVYDPATQETVNYLGQGGAGGFRDGGPDVAAFDEPGGLDYAEGRLYVADTNNHAIRIIDLETQTASTVTFSNPEALVLDRRPVTIVGGNAAQGETLALDTQTIAPGEGSLTLDIVIPEGYKLNPLIDSTLEILSAPDVISLEATSYALTGSQVSLPASFSEGDGTLEVQLTVYYCEAEQEAYCLIDDVSVELPFTIAEDGSESLELPRTIILPEVETGGF